MKNADELWPELETAGEEMVRQRLAEGAYGPQKIPLVKEWLATKDRERAQATEGAQQARESRSLTLADEANIIARDSNAIARGANRISWVAVAIALLALLVSIVAAVVETGK